ncbi:MAG: polysaccharide pyruvyl transferase family protein [Microbacteriaceae bacterium]|nr:polysaccharide pyruvyl transferase family protein [Microbacteriaceae bacterium]
MIVTVRGAYGNAGDHLIGRRAHALLARHVDDDIQTVDRRAITDESYELMNRARAVLLTGGPAYQRQLHPGIYPLDLDRIRVPVVPYGLGWKARTDATPASFEFTSESLEFVRRIHSDPRIQSSARCYQTVDLLEHNGVDNVLMTGCPVWYDEDRLAEDYVFPERIHRLVISLPAKPRGDTVALARHLAKRFPNAERFVSYQSGFRAASRVVTAKRWAERVAVARHGFRPVDFAGDADAMIDFMSGVDLHVGYRVHSHLFSLSRRITSVLFAEDSRAIGQAEATGGHAVPESASNADKIAEVNRVLDTHGADIARAVERMRETFPTMLRFLGQF